MPSERINRLLKLITILQRKEPNRTKSLMAELAVGRRTLFRDLRTISEAGIPHVYDRKNGHQLSSQFAITPSNLSIEETLGLMVLAKSISNHRGRPMVAPALSGIQKALATVPDQLRSICEHLLESMSISPEKQVVDKNEERYHKLFQNYIEQCVSCRIVYNPEDQGDNLHAVFDPYLLHFVGRAWYVIGYVDVDDRVQMLRLTRFEEVDPTDERFDHPKNFKASDLLKNAWSTIPEGRMYDIELMFSSKVTANVCSFNWHETQQHQMLPDGSCRMSFKVNGIGEIAWWICGHADQVTVIKPDVLRERVYQMLRSAAEQYEKVSPDVKILAKSPAGHQPRRPDTSTST